MKRISLVDRMEVLLFVRECCGILKVDVSLVLGKTRVTPIPAKRHAIIEATRRRFLLTVTELGKLFNRDHTSICWARKKAEDNEQAAHEFLIKILQQTYKRLL